MERIFCKDKKGFCNCLENCRKCEFAKGNGVIDGGVAHDVLATLFGYDYDLDRLRELVEADKNGRCFVRPDFVFRIGETRGIIKVPYKSWMGRFMGTKFYKSEKEAAEAAIAKEAE